MGNILQTITVEVWTNIFTVINDFIDLEGNFPNQMYQNSNELNIYWLSGISKDSIINFLVKIGILMIAIYIFISTFITPWTLGKSRMVLAQSKFSLINSLVKENNFNSPLSGLTIYVSKNDNKGN